VCAYHCAQVFCTTQHNISDNFPSYPPDSHHCLDDVYWRRGEREDRRWKFVKSLDSTAQMDGVKTKTRKAPTQGRTGHFVIYLQCAIKVCFSTAETELLFPISLSLSSEKGTRSSRDLELWHMSLNNKHDLFWIKENHPDKYIRQRLFSFENFLTNTQTQQTYCITWTTKRWIKRKKLSYLQWEVCYHPCRDRYRMTYAAAIVN